MKFVIDMNLSPSLAKLIHSKGWEAVHWAAVGNPRATDRTIMKWALDNGYIVLTNDLDFGHILAATGASCPSVIQIRAQDISPSHISPILFNIFEQYKSFIEAGALVTVDESRSRVRLLPLKK